MVRKLLGVALLFTAGVGFCLADEIRAVITKVDGGNITFAESKGKGERGPEKTLPTADALKVVKGKFNQETKKLEAGEALDAGLKNEVFTKIGEKGVRATIITDADNKKITEIRVGGGRKKSN